MTVVCLVSGGYQTTLVADHRRGMVCLGDTHVWPILCLERVEFILLLCDMVAVY